MERDSGILAEGEPATRFSSATAVGRFRKPLVEYLLSGLEDDDKRVRILAADILGSVGDPRAIEYLTPLLVDRDRDLRTISAYAIDMIRSHKGAMFQSRPDPCACCMIRVIAEEALAKQKTRN